MPMGQWVAESLAGSRMSIKPNLSCLKQGKRKKKYLRDFIKLFAGRLLMPETERAEHLKLAIQ